MNPNTKMFGLRIRGVVAVLCALALVSGDSLANIASPQSAQVSSPQSQAVAIAPDQLDALVAPVALYPDPLLAQTLAASTYPLEIIQLQQWLAKNPGLKDKALADAVAKQQWDPSIQALAALPDVVKRLADDIQWTTDLGNAFLAQQNDVMDAVQRMRKKAQDTGNLKSTEQQKVETSVIENKSVIVVEQANPQVVYVPSYDPVVVYGPAVYPYPRIYYPPAGYYAAGLAISFGVGVMMGAFWSGGWGWGCGWGGNDININRNNNFNRNTNIGGGNRNNIGGGNRPSNQPARGAGNRPSTQPVRGGGDRGGAGNKWQHSPQHRGGAPYRDRATADRFGGTTRGDSLANRQAGARQQVGRQGGNLAGDRAGDGRLSNRAGGGLGAGNRLSGGGQIALEAGTSRAVAQATEMHSEEVPGVLGDTTDPARANSSRGASSRGCRSGGFGGGGGRGGGGRRR